MIVNIISKNLTKHFTITDKILAYVLAIGALISPFLPKVNKWLMIAYIICVFVYFSYIVIKRLGIIRKIIHGKLPFAIHSDWNSNNEKFNHLFQDIDVSVLKKIEISSIVLLIADRLHTGAWSKTQIARFVKNNKSLSPVGSLTGTYMVLESLRFYQYHKLQEQTQQLFSNLAKLILHDGIVVHKKELTATGGIQVKSEEPRHASGFFLIRPIMIDLPLDADYRLMKRISDDLRNRLKRDDKSDMQGTAFEVTALLSALYWMKKQTNNEIDIIKRTIQFFNGLKALSTPGHPDWSEEPGGKAASNIAAQWVIAWLLAGFLSWKEININNRMKLADRLLSLIESNMSLIPGNNLLLPHSFKGQRIRLPQDESMLATGVALYISLLSYLIFKDKDILERSKNNIINLIQRIIFRGFDFLTRDDLDGQLEGYLAWSSSLLCLRPIIYRFNEKFAASDTLKKAIAFVSDQKDRYGIFDDSEREVLLKAITKINRIYHNAQVKVYPGGLFQKID